MSGEYTEALAVIGAGSWGTALAIALHTRFREVRLWSHHAEDAASIERTRENARFLPGFSLPECVRVSSDLGDCMKGANVVLTVVPSRYLRGVASQLCPYVQPEMCIVSATKGIEAMTFLRMSQVLADEFREKHPAAVAVLSGPTFAREIAAGEPAAVVLACEDQSLAEEMQRRFATKRLRLYASTDVVGVELGAALKNVIAMAAGVCRGLGLGSNSVAALVTRGLAEITRLAVGMGGQQRTLSGLAGLGDLVLTATGDLSRNRSVGIRLGQGEKLADILAGMSMVAEGVATCGAAYQLGLRENVDLPLIRAMHQVLYDEVAPRDAIRELMERPLTNE